MKLETHALVTDRKPLEAFCARWNVRELSLFGSALRDDFHAQSDVDVLIELAEEEPPSLESWLQMREELEEIFQRPVDLLRKRVVEQSRNWIRRRAILEQRHILHAQ